jgi:hypothetical protein
MRTFNTTIKMLLGAWLLLGTVACEDFLTEDPKGRLATQTFFSNKNDLNLALNALYQIVADAQHANHYTGTNLLAGDDITTHPASNKQPLREHDQYEVSDNNAWMPYLWQNRWAMVKAANFVINNAAKTPEVSEADIRTALAQAHYWRAYAYFYLVQTWGPVPVMLEEVVDYEAPLAPVEEIYELIVADLKIAEQAPVLYTSAPYARNGMNISVSQGAAKATLAYVYLSMAGWPLNRGTEYYQLAAAKAKEVIDAADNGTYYYTLLDEYGKVYSWTYNDQNPEVILGIYYNRDRTVNMSTVTDFLQDMQHGGGWDDTHGEIKFWKNFPDGPRKEASYFPKLLLNDGVLHDWWWDTDPPSRAVVAPCFIKTAEGADRGTEFDYTDPRAISYNGEKMHQVVRLSEVYCWYAEAVGRSGQVNAQAVDVLNRVRNRADGKASNLYSTGMTPDQLAEAAYDEHGWEIGGYYWGCIAPRARDMFRMYRMKEHFEYRKQNPMIEVAPGVFRNENVPVAGTWDDSKMYIPYPYGDVILNPNLKR